jgi:ABC-2 type transport system ATP-binding protein
MDTPLAITATGGGLSKVSVNTVSSSLLANHHEFPGVSQQSVKEGYAIYFSTDIGQTVSALIAYVQSHQDTLIDLRVERPSLEDRFLELTNGGAK